MDHQRFDTFTRALARGVPRRSVLKTIAAAIAGGAAAAKAADDADAACKKLGQTCAAQTDCCTGLTCTDGICKCGPGQEKCNAAGAITCVPACPPGQYMGSGCRCLCLTTGRPPTANSCPCITKGGACSPSAPCCGGLVCTAGVCVVPCVEEGGACSEGSDCCGDLTCIDGVCAFACFENGEGCTEDSDCCEGLICTIGSICEEPYECGPATWHCGGEDDVPCCEGLICSDGVCEVDTAISRIRS